MKTLSAELLFPTVFAGRENCRGSSAGWLSLICVLAFAWSSSAAAASLKKEVRVRILDRQRPSEVRVRSTEKKRMRVTLISEDGSKQSLSSREVVVRCGGKTPLLVISGKNSIPAGRVELRPRTRPGILRIMIPGLRARTYPGWLEITEKEGRCQLVNRLPLEHYVREVACAEIRGSGPEALKAQTVLVRNFSLTRLNRHKNEGFDFCDLTHCQVFVGEQSCSSKQHRWQRAVSGRVMLYRGRLVEPYYFSSCGGHTANGAEVWGRGSDRPYLKGVKDGKPPYCAGFGRLSWRLELDAEKLCQDLRKLWPELGNDSCQVKVEKVGSGGWVSKVRLIGDQESVLISGEKFQMTLGRMYGWGKFKSARFQVRWSDNKVVFRGKGMGHGVGMCQRGAMGMEKRGHKYGAILRHYFPGTKLGKWR